ncbi:uncharacterized protein LOC111412559 [Olea europaea var. sylvestris]|uniref:uncharacterized protein LOC111412559 n=1 Tax=Olea europaea var. sylvestris TaxID=158386 RepID=UPI000C1D4F83|nr:uncharacterized protein LOC111412559 [Olea europaea var. sylvestris]
MEKDQENHPDSMMEDDQNSDGAETVAPTGGSADKPLPVKIKFPNVKERMDEDNMKDGPKVKDHCCVVCKRSFSSGKALGGHISSAHAQTNRDFSLKKLKPKKKRRPKQLVGFGSPSGYGGKNICKICGRGFLTNKSLFGHMRSHPDREWRGMEPPAEAARKFSEHEFEAMNKVPLLVLDPDQIDSGPVVTSEAIGLNKTVKWLVIGKRGRAPAKPVNESPPFPNSKEILAVQQLIRLVNGDSTKPSEDLNSKVKEGEVTSSNYWIPEGETDYFNQNFQLKKKREKAFPVGDEGNSPVEKLKIWERTDENPGSPQSKRFLHKGEGKGKLNPEISISSDYSPDMFDEPHKQGTNGSMIIKNRTTEEKKSVDQELPPNFSPIGPATKSVLPAVTPDKYICSSCGKSFTTPQALGGHRSSHKKFKVKIYNTIDDQSSNEASYAFGVQNQCHSTGECNRADHVTPTDKAKKEHKVFEFDLNERLNQDDEGGMEPASAAVPVNAPSAHA